MSISRNVVILGKDGSGKRTLGNHIVGRDVFRRETALSTGNVGAHYRESIRGDASYRILTLDTGSPQTGYYNPVPYIQLKFHEIHSIIFTIPKGHYTDQTHRSLMHAVESLDQQAKSISALVITRCEGITDEQREAIIAEFRDDARGAQVIAFTQHGTQAVGFPDISALPPNIRPILQDAIDRDEESIRKLVERCKVPLSAKALQPYYKPSPSASAGLQRHKRTSSGASPKNQQQRTPTEPDHEHKGIGASQPKTAGQGISLPKSPERRLENQRTVIIIGKFGSGKRTLANRLAGRKIFGISSVDPSGTRNVSALYAEFLEGDPTYRILTVDTEGLQTGHNNPIFYYTQNFQTINSIIFVIPKGRYTIESHGSLMHAVRSFRPRGALISALVITHCEGMAEQERLDTIAEFRASNSCAPIAAFMQKGIYTVGFPDTILPEVREIMEDKMVEDTESIKTLVGRCETAHPVEDLITRVVQ